MNPDNELVACAPIPLDLTGFNHSCVLPYGLQTAHMQAVMGDFLDFLGFINGQLYTKKISRLDVDAYVSEFQ